MTISEILNHVEFRREFVDLHIVDRQVTGFYKTHVVKYKNAHNENVSYLFPTSFKWENNKLKTTMVFGSVERTFHIPQNINGTGHGTELKTVDVYPNYYKLLIAEQINTESWRYDSLDLKPFVCIIEALCQLEFPFMRITNNHNIKSNPDMRICNAR